MASPPVVTGPARVALVVALALLATCGLAFYTVRRIAPNIVGAGQRSAEEEAVSHLREILWAEEIVRRAKAVDRDGDGRGEFASLAELTGQPGASPRSEAPLASGRFTAAVDNQVATKVDRAPVAGVDEGANKSANKGVGEGVNKGPRGALRSQGYLYVVYLPARDPTSFVSEGEAEVDPARAAARFIAYAWPADDKAGRRAFYIDEADRICETVPSPAGARYVGLDRAPAATAALPQDGGEMAACGVGGDGLAWRAWRNKAARAGDPRRSP